VVPRIPPRIARPLPASAGSRPAPLNRMTREPLWITEVPRDTLLLNPRGMSTARGALGASRSAGRLPGPPAAGTELAMEALNDAITTGCSPFRLVSCTRHRRCALLAGEGGLGATQ
jgi:hypothetical protein